ncbi:MAG: uroporphyrinogen-III C-methyltransferase [Elusimicrobia bacterium]|nr:uroporphyrinogen-III C-methyltransferase [Elusimicrobiota bacterium]
MIKNKIKIVTRKSPLAVIQTEEIINSISDINFKIITVESYGDKNKHLSLMSDVPPDFFTRELDNAVISGKADIAVHSAKDLPVPLMEGLEVIALTKAEDSTDCLVSRDNLPLKKLNRGSKIGTSSISRKKQLLDIRPDLEIVPVRGIINERLALVESGKIDALVVATCAIKRMGLTSKITEILPFETHPLQGSLAIVAKQSRSDLKVLFSKIDVRMSYGKVYLIGAGPGIRDLLTIKAETILQNADIIFYDDLIDKTLLNNYLFHKVYVGKRKGKYSLSQNEINHNLYEAAKKKQVVVRLKGGDPFVFGRGGEELVYLRERYIDVEIVPGITAAQTASASAELPLTMRGLSNKLSLLSGHNAEENFKTEGETLVYYMGASKLKEIKSYLIKQKHDIETPVVLINKAGFWDERVLLTNISNMNVKLQKSPLIVIVGKTAGLFRQRKKILFTGINPYNCLVPGHLIYYPLIKIHPIKFDVDITKYEGIVFTSGQSVHFFCERYIIPQNMKILSIGPQTSKELKKYGYKINSEAGFPDSDVLAELIKNTNLKKILYPCSNLSDNKIHKLPSVEKKVIYKTIAVSQVKVNLKMFSGIVFTSPSTVDSFFNIYGNIPSHIVVSVFGKHTKKRLKEKGYIANVQTILPAYAECPHEVGG